MATPLVTVEQAAERLSVHPKTVLRYIRERRLPATRIGKSYRIVRSALDAFAGVATTSADAEGGLSVRATCVVDVAGMSTASAEQMATFLNAAATAGKADVVPIHLETAFDPMTRTLKVVAFGSPSATARLLEMLQLKLDALS